MTDEGADGGRNTEPTAEQVLEMTKNKRRHDSLDNAVIGLVILGVVAMLAWALTQFVGQTTVVDFNFVVSLSLNVAITIAGLSQFIRATRARKRIKILEGRNSNLEDRLRRSEELREDAERRRDELEADVKRMRGVSGDQPRRQLPDQPG